MKIKIEIFVIIDLLLIFIIFFISLINSFLVKIDDIKDFIACIYSLGALPFLVKDYNNDYKKYLQKVKNENKFNA